MGPETKQFRERIIKIAKADYIDTFLRKYPQITNYTMDNVQVLRGKNIHEFSLMIINPLGCVLDTKSFKYSDF